MAIMNKEEREKFFAEAAEAWNKMADVTPEQRAQVLAARLNSKTISSNAEWVEIAERYIAKEIRDAEDRGEYRGRIHAKKLQDAAIDLVLGIGKMLEAGIANGLIKDSDELKPLRDAIQMANKLSV